jgi:hypothetical protein
LDHLFGQQKGLPDIAITRFHRLRISEGIEFR